MYVYNAVHVRGHVLVCLRAHYVEWHLLRMASLLFEEQDREAAQQRRHSVVAEAPGKRTRMPDRISDVHATVLPSIGCCDDRFVLQSNSA